MMKGIGIILLLILTFGCTEKKGHADKALLKAEIFKVENDFKNMAQTKGIPEAFYFFADSAAVIKRDNDSLISGKEAIKAFFSNEKYEKAQVTWKPDFVDVADDGSLAYTYGKYIWTATDSLGNKKEYKGRFHTVWKKQKDGSWKYVWD